MFGLPTLPNLGGSFAHQGAQVRGFGFLHDGSIDTIFRFTSTVLFTIDDTEQQQLEALIMAFPTDLPPMVGQQITRTSTSGSAVNNRINTMIAAAGDIYPSKLLGPGSRQCDVIVKGVIAGLPRGGLLVSGNKIQLDDGSAPASETSIRSLANTPGQELTYTCVPYGSGLRMGIDRDEDGDLDAIDNCPDVYNPNQTDADDDGIGDVCAEGGATTTTTTLPELCGNGVIDGAEECDGADLGGNDCTSVGQLSGTLACYANCTFNLEGCALQHGALMIRSVKVSRLSAAAGEQRLSLSSNELSQDVPVVTDPLVEEVRFSLTSPVTSPASLIIPAGDPRWQLRGRKFVWKAGDTPLPGGLSRVTIGMSDQPFKVKIKLADFIGTPLASASAVAVAMWIGNDGWFGADKPCTLSASGNTLSCR
jgi:hypothetical protein